MIWPGMWPHRNLGKGWWVTSVLVGLVLLVTPAIGEAQAELEGQTEFGELPEGEELSEVDESPEVTEVLQLAPSADLTIVDFIISSAPSISSHRVGLQLALHGTEANVERVANVLSEADLLDELASQYGSRRPICETVRLYYVREPALLAAMLTAVKDEFAPDVTVQTMTQAPQGTLDLEGGQPPGKQPPLLVLAGPPSQIRNLKRVIAAIDVPQPQVRLDLWAFQISGSEARKVAERGQQARECVATISRLMRGYLQQLEAYACEQQLENQRRVAEHSLGVNLEPRFEAKFSIEPQQMMTPVQIGGGSCLITPSRRGRHPLSLTETLTTILMVQPEGSEGLVPGSLQSTVATGLTEHLGRWLNHVSEQDPQALQTWLRLLKQEHSQSGDNLAHLLEHTIAPVASRESSAGIQATEVPSREAVQPLLPYTLLEMFWDEDYMEVARQSIGNFLLDYEKGAKDWQGLPPDRLSREAADVDVALQMAARALAQDIQTLFLHPLLNELQNIAGDGDRHGLSSSSTTTISVLSGVEAHVEGNTHSYFDMTQPATLDAATLQRAADLTQQFQQVLPPPSGRQGRRAVARVRLSRREDLPVWEQNLTNSFSEGNLQVWAQENDCSLMLVGGVDDVSSALTLLRTAGVVQESSSTVQPGEVVPLSRPPAERTSLLGGQFGGLPLEQVLGLGMALSKPRGYWSSVSDGADFTFTPYVLPGAAAAELTIDFTVTHNDPETLSQQGGSGPEGTAVLPINRVARHQAKTTVYVHALDLFALSSLTLRTTHPRPAAVVPVLGQVPLLGRMFRFPKGPSTVHHESVLMVYSTILPTGMDVGSLLDFEMASSEG